MHKTELCLLSLKAPEQDGQSTLVKKSKTVFHHNFIVSVVSEKKKKYILQFDIMLSFNSWLFITSVKSKVHFQQHSEIM